MKHLSQRAFSLFELMAAITIAAVIALISIPAVSSFAKTTKVKTEAQRIARLIENIGAKANYSRQDILLIFLSEEYRAKYARSGKAVAKRLIPKGVDIRPITRAQFTFYKTSVATPGTIKVSDESSFCLVQVSLRSRVSTSCG